MAEFINTNGVLSIAKNKHGEHIDLLYSGRAHFEKLYGKGSQL